MENKKTKILFLIDYFPGFVGYNGNGASMILERLTTGLSMFASERFIPILSVSVGREKNNTKVYPFEIVENVSDSQLLELLKKHNAKDTILHIGRIFLMAHQPELFKKILSLWQGPVVQRVPDIPGFEVLKAKLDSEFLPYLSRIDAFVSQGDKMSSELFRLGIETARIFQIVNGVSLSEKFPLSEEGKITLRQELIPNLGETDTLFLYAGRLYDATKRIDHLLRAWINGGFATRGNHLVLAGEYNNEKRDTQGNLAALLRRCSPEEIRKKNIHFVGLLPETELVRYYQIADVYVTPSEREGFSNAALEALAFGLPVIARRGVSGNEHLIAEGKTGLLFSTVHELEESMRILEGDGEMRKRFGLEGRKLAEESFSVEGMVKKNEQMYLTLLQRNGAL